MVTAHECFIMRDFIGSFRISHQGASWVIQPYKTYPNFTKYYLLNYTQMEYDKRNLISQICSHDYIQYQCDKGRNGEIIGTILSNT